MEILTKFTEKQMELYVEDDPVRPHLNSEFRTTYNSEVYALIDEDKVNAIICLAHTRKVPTNEDELTSNAKEGCEHIISPYTVWSYAPGAGRRIVNLVIEMVKEANQHKDVKPRIVTLSPKTRMAERFHISNGATFLSENDTTNNFEYKI